MTLRIFCSRAKNGLSPVVVSALLIVVLIGSISVVYIWFSVQQKAGNAIYIQSVNSDDSNLIIYVQNIGEDSVEMDSIFINNDGFTVTSVNCMVANQNTTKIEKGQTAIVTINNSYHGQIHIRVVCKDGTNTMINWKSE